MSKYGLQAKKCPRKTLKPRYDEIFFVCLNWLSERLIDSKLQILLQETLGRKKVTSKEAKLWKILQKR